MLTTPATGLLFALLSLLPASLAKTDMQGCVSSETVVYGGASLVWYLPDTGEICAFLDCGGGRAPPKTTVPGCPLYEGTATYSPSYLPGFAAATPTSEAAGGAATDDAVTIPLTTEPLTGSASGSGLGPTTAETTVESSLSQPTTITGSLKSTKTETDLTPPTITTSAIAGTTAASSSSSSSTAAAAMVTAGAREILGLAAGLVAGLAAI